MSCVLTALMQLVQLVLARSKTSRQLLDNIIQQSLLFADYLVTRLRSELTVCRKHFSRRKEATVFALKLDESISEIVLIARVPEMLFELLLLSFRDI